MGAEWASRCAGEGIKLLEDGMVEVSLGQRRHIVQIVDEGLALRLTARVARPAAVRALEELPLRLALRNRTVPVVGFHLDARGAVVGEARVSKAGLSPEELRFVLRRAAVECDRLEFELTGEDLE